MRQPFLVDILLHGPCNFDCYYCCADTTPDKKVLKGNNFGMLSTKRGVKELMTLLDELGVCEVSLCGTGEASLFPNFFSLCETITKKHYLTLVTNMSFDDRCFMKKIPAKRVSGILMSLHPSHEKDMDGFIGRVGFYKSKGYPVAIIYVAHPLRIANIPRLYETFDQMGVEFRIAPFNGCYKGREYPASYTKKERKTILSHNFMPNTFYRIERGFRLHKGKLCLAGYRQVDIDDRTGDVLRCYDSGTVLGNLYRGKIQILEIPLPCDACVCGCHEHAEEARQVKKHLINNRSKNGTPALFGAKDAAWYNRLCEPIWREYEGMADQLRKLGVKHIRKA